jgi:hypothetical protein
MMSLQPTISVMAAIDYREAARRLDLSERQVERLVRSGELLKVHRGLVDERSLALHQARIRRPGRGWDEATAWAAIAILTGHRADWLGQTQRSRLKSMLKQLSAEDVVARARNRATVNRLGGLDSAVRRAAGEIVDVHANDADLGLTGSGRVDGYVAAADLPGLVRRLRLHEDLGGRLMLRSTTFDIDVVRSLAGHGHVVAALDLAESTDPRERRAGLDALAAALDGLRHG